MRREALKNAVLKIMIEKMELKNVILIYFVIQNINMCMKINPMK